MGHDALGCIRIAWRTAKALAFGAGIRKSGAHTLDNNLSLKFGK